MYSFDSFVRYSEVGEDKKLTLDGIINYFQDCSTFQCEELQVGVERLEALQRVWVLSSWQIVIDRYPALCEKIRISTWPYQFQGFLGWRNFTMTDGDGKLLAWANSLCIHWKRSWIWSMLPERFPCRRKERRESPSRSRSIIWTPIIM